MGRLIEKKTGKSWDVPPDEMEAALASGLYDIPEGETTTIAEGGYTSAVPVEELVGQLERGAVGEAPGDLFARQERARKEREHGGIGTAITTGLETGLSTATLGGYDAAGRLLGGEDFATRRRESKEVHDTADTIGTVGGFVIPALLTGGTGAAGSLARNSGVGLAERAGQAILKTGAEKGLAGRLATTAAGYGLEGGLINIGEGVSELALSEDPLNTERVVGTLSSKFFAGVGIGGAAGLAGKAAEAGLGRAKGMLDDVTAKLRARGSSAVGDLANLDKAGLREARRTTANQLGEEVVAGARAIDGTSDLFHVATGSDKKVLTDARKWITKHLDDPKGLAENPNLIAKSLRKEEEILRKTIDDQGSVLAKLAKNDEALLAKLDGSIKDFAEDVVLKGDEGALYGQLNGINVTRKHGVTLDKAGLEEFRALVQSGAAGDLRAGAMSRLPKALEENIALQASIDGIKHGTAPRLAEIQAASDAFTGVAKKGALEKLANTTLTGAGTAALSPVIGFWGGGIAASKAADAITDIVFGRMAKAGADAGLRSAKALEAFMAAGTKAARLAPPLASKTLSSVAFGPEPSKIANQLANKPSQGLSGAYLAREKELRSVTQRGPDGALQMRPGARQELADRLAPIRAVNPMVADQMETIGARRVSFLASKLPKRPDLPVMQMGPDNWRPSDMAIRRFARYVAAVEDPGSIEERLADGSVTPEDAEAIRTVYPEMYEDIKMRIIQELPRLQEQLPYERRLALSIFSGVPVDPAMHPRILRVLQASFANEPGSEGGTQAPRAQPRFGTMTKPEATPAQERAG